MTSVIPHLLSGVLVTKNVFTQSHVTHLKARLVATIANSTSGKFKEYDATKMMPADIIHYSFPMLRWDYRKGEDPDHFLCKQHTTAPKGVTMTHHPTINDGWYVCPPYMRVKLPPNSVEGA